MRKNNKIKMAAVLMLLNTLATFFLYTSTASAADYTYVFLVQSKVQSGKLQKYDADKGFVYVDVYDKYTYTYDDFGMVSESKRSSTNPYVSERQTGTTQYQDDNAERLVGVDGPYFHFVYTYNSDSLIKKYTMQCDEAIMGWSGPWEYTNRLKYRKKDKSIYNPECGGLSLLSDGDRYFFDSHGRPQKTYFYKNYSGKSWNHKFYYYYDKRSNLIERESVNVSGSPFWDYKRDFGLTYKNNLLVKRTEPKDGDLNSIKVRFKYRKTKVQKKYVKKIKDQQWRIMNFSDLDEFGINQPWKY